MSARIRIPRPTASEYGPFYRDYIASVPGEDAWPVLDAQADAADRALASLSNERALHRYASGKWSVKEVVGHLIDCERIFAYRALRFARADATPLPSFDENRYVVAGRFDTRSMGDVVDDFRVVRASTLALFRSLEDDALLQSGVANEQRLSVRALAWVAAGHAQHHLDVLRERYGVA
jgi:hypothetical protein